MPRRRTGAPAIRPIIKGRSTGERIAYALAHTSESLSKVARDCDVSWLACKRWATEETVPHVHNLIDLAEALGTTGGSLLGHYPPCEAWDAFYKKRKKELDHRMIENLRSVAMMGIRPTIDLYDDLYLALRRAADATDQAPKG